MKSVFIFALVALAATGPSQSVPFVDKVVVGGETTPTTGFYAPGEYGFFGEEYGPQGKIFEVAQYIAYQFHLIQELGYTPSQVATYFLEHGFPKYVVDYLVQIYEAGLSEPYFRSPYLIFEYYSKHEFSAEVQQYIFREIVQALHMFQNYFLQYGQKAFEYEYPGVPQLFSKYVVYLGRYYNGNGFTYSSAKLVFEQLRLVEKYSLSAIQFLESGKVPEEVYQYVYKPLKQVLEYIQGAESAYQIYQVYQQKYVPYYFAQYYSYQVSQAFQYFSNIYQYIQKSQGTLPEYFVEQIRLAYFALQKVYAIFEPTSYPTGGSGIFRSLIKKYSSKSGDFPGSYSGYGFGDYGYEPYSSSYGYGSYGPYSSSYGYQYKPYSSSYGYGSYGPSSSSYGYGSYEPYSSSYGYGSYGPYSSGYGYKYEPYISSYGYQYKPYSSSYGYGSYGPYSSSYGYQYKPYSSSYGYGSYGPYSSGYGYKYEPYSSSYGYQYKPYSSSYGYGSYTPYSSSYGYQYKPYSSSYGYGSYSPYSSSYGYGSYESDSYKPYSSYGYQYGSYGSYSPDSSYGYPYYPYSSSYGSYAPYSSSAYGSGSYDSSYSYAPYSSSYGKYGSYSPYKYGSYSQGYSGYPYGSFAAAA